MPPPKSYLCYRATEPIEINGRLDKSVWQVAPWTDWFVDIEGDLRPLPRLATRARLLWDDDYLYIGAEMEEPHVWGTLTEHDSVIFQDNDFEIFLDPDGDNHSYFEIEINALNTVWDLRLVKPYRDGGPALDEWEIPGLKTAVSIDGTLNDPSDKDRGWSVELAIPWSAMAEHAGRRVPPTDGEQWRVNFSRVEWDVDIRDGGYHKIPNRPEHNWVWSPQGAIDMHRPERWGFVQFTNATPGEAMFVPDPSFEARERLMAVYHAQRAYQRQTGSWAGDLTEIFPRPGELDSGAPTLRLTAGGWEATLPFTDAAGMVQTVRIREDSRIWVG